MSEKLRHIALLTDGIYPYVTGGMQKHSWYLARYFAARKVKVELFYFKEQNPGVMAFTGDELEFINLHEIRWQRTDNLPGHYLRESFQYSIRVFDALKPLLNQLDFIYAKGFSAWKLLDARRKGLSTPKIAVNFHGLEMFQPAPSFQQKIALWMLRTPTKFNLKESDIAVSYGGHITPLLRKILGPDHPILEIPTGIEATWLNEEAREPASPYKFLFIGRFERRKGVEELSSLLLNWEGNLPFEFEFIGPIPEDKQVNRPGITYHGKIMDQKELRAIAQQCDVLVTPSFSEGMPNVIMEAMASGLAVIATDVGAVGEMVGEDNGALIPPRDQKALEEAFKRLLSFPKEKMQTLQENSIRKVREQFLWSRVIDRTIEGLEEMV